MVFSVIPVAKNNQVYAQTATVPEGYKGIYTLMNLYAIRNDLDGKYILMNDIDMTEATAKGGNLDCGNGWASIQNFEGEFNGNGHRIIGMNKFGTLSPYFYTTDGTDGFYYCGLH